MAVKSVEWTEVASGVYRAEANGKELKVWISGGKWYASVGPAGRLITLPGAYYETEGAAKQDAQRWAYLPD
jgi:hypothetical protein